jgi:predicted ATPase
LRLLDPQVRLLTFTGPGGTGKTRVAIEVATTIAHRFTDGAHFVDLSPVRDPSLASAMLAINPWPKRWVSSFISAISCSSSTTSSR